MHKLLLSSILLSSTLLTACGDYDKAFVSSDTTAPLVNLIGDNSIIHAAGTDYIELGATATDTVDGSVSVIISGIVDSTKVASYVVAYAATDSAGNISAVTRTVNVVDMTAKFISLNGDSGANIVKDKSFKEGSSAATFKRVSTANVWNI